MKPGKHKTEPFSGFSGFEILRNNENIGDLEVLYLVTEREANRVPRAILHLREGEAAKQDFPTSSQFQPGDTVDISVILRESGTQLKLFKGEIVSLQVKMRNGRVLLALEIKDPLVRMTLGRKSAVFKDTTDGDAIGTILSNYSITADVSVTDLKHPELIQFHACDWDFMISRAEANGLLVYPQLDKVEIKPPAEGAADPISVSFGRDLIDFDAEVKAESQYPKLETGTWDETNLEWEASEESVEAEGLDNQITERTWLGGHRPKDELQAWNQAQKERIERSKVRGKAKVFGVDAYLGQLLQLEGVGPLFTGEHLITGIRQEIKRGTWTTTLQFGMHPKLFSEEHPDMHAKPAGGLLPAVPGLQTGVVSQVKDDPEEGYRIAVQIGNVQSGDPKIWARLATLDAGPEHGSFFVPDPGDQVVIGFLQGDPRDAIILGSLWGKKNEPPNPMDDAENLKGYYAEEKSRIVFDKDYKSIEISTSDGANSLTIDGDADSIHLVDNNQNEILFDSGGILISSKKDIKIESKGTVSISGVNVEVTADANLDMEGQAGAELTSSAVTTIKGSLIKLN